MPSISTKWLYPICVFLAILLYLLTQNAEYPHPDSSYLHARYARNLVEGEGFVYNPDERILLTWSPLIVLTHAAWSLPEGEVNNPPELLMFVVMGIGAAAFMRHFLHAGFNAVWAVSALFLWLIVAFSIFGGVEWWLATFTLVAIDLAWSKKWQPAGIVAGLMVLISPIAIIFVMLLGIQAIREKAIYWRWVWWPALIWYSFAAWYFGADGLHGLTLVSSGNKVVSSAVLMLFSTVIIFWLYRSIHTLSPLIAILITWGISYTLVSILLNQNNPVLLTLAGMTAAAFSIKNEIRILQGASALAITGLLVLVFVQRDKNEPVRVPENLNRSIGYWGSYQEAFALNGAVYQLEGKDNPHLYDLKKHATFQDILIATAPDVILDANFAPPADTPIQLLNYVENGDIWQRQSEVYPWQNAQEVNLDFGPDLLLKSLTVDRTQIEPGGILRLRLDWERKNAYTPDYEVIFILQLLNQQQAVSGAIQHNYPKERFRQPEITTYHVVPVNEDAMPGVYDILLIVDYNGGILGRHTLARVKIPPSSDREFTEPALANFDNRAELMQVDMQREGENLVVNLVWRAQGTFDADYTVFVHLIPVNDVQPVSQGDAPPAYPTSIWEKGEVIEDTHFIPLQNVPPGTYMVRVGFFHPDRGRLPTESGDSVIIGEIQIE